MTAATDDRTQHVDHPALTPVLRWLSNLIRLSALCARPSCRRAHACRGEPRDCLARYAPLVPEGAEAMVDGMLRHLPFDDLREEEPAVDDLIAWRALLDGCAARAKATRRAPMRRRPDHL